MTAQPEYTAPAMSVDLEVMSNGAGVQSSAIAWLIRDGALPRPDVAIFADTGWEPKSVYEHMQRVGDLLAEVGVPVETVSAGNLRSDALDLDKPIKLPAFVKNADGSQGKHARSCTDRYKLRPIRARIRELLGAPLGAEFACSACDGAGARVAPWRAKRGDMTVGVCSVCDGEGVLSRVGLPPRVKSARVWIGFSTDEADRATDRGPRYAKPWHPLLTETPMSRQQCIAYLASKGWANVPKSACIGCPFHGNAIWRSMRNNDPAAWQDAVTFDEEFRHDPGLRGEQYLHRSMLPLRSAPIERIEASEWRDAQGDLFEDGDPQGCSPYGCSRDDAA